MCLPTYLTKPQSLSTESYGILLMLISAMLYSAQGVLLKFSANLGIPSTQLVFFRATFQLIITIAFMVPSSLLRRPFGSSIPVIKVVLARGFLGGIGFILFFFSVSSLPIGDAVTLFSLYPIITLFMAKIFLGEDMDYKQIVAAVASLIGGALIAGPSFLSLNNTSSRRLMHGDHNLINIPLSHIDTTRDSIIINSNYNSLGYATAIIGSFFASSVIVLIRKAGTMNVHTLHLLFSWGVFGVTLSIVAGKCSFIRDNILGEKPWIYHLPSTEAGVYVLAMCTVGSIAHFFMNYGGKMAPAGLGSIARSSDVLWAYGWELVIFKNVPMPTTILGVVMILISLSLVATVQIEKKNKVEERNNKYFVGRSDNGPLNMADKYEGQSHDEENMNLCSSLNTSYGSTAERKC